jgi:DedD protein
MALLDKAYKQRMVGALVLVALAVIFLPMLFSRQDEQRQVTVEAPAAPQAPACRSCRSSRWQCPSRKPCRRSQCQVMKKSPSRHGAAAPIVAADADGSHYVTKPVAPHLAPAAKPLPAPAQPITAATSSKPDTTQSRVDANGLSVSWSVQLASLSSRASAESCRKPCAAKATTLISVRPMARIGCLSGR